MNQEQNINNNSYQNNNLQNQNPITNQNNLNSGSINHNQNILSNTTIGYTQPQVQPIYPDNNQSITQTPLQPVNSIISEQPVQNQNVYGQQYNNTQPNNNGNINQNVSPTYNEQIVQNQNSYNPQFTNNIQPNNNVGLNQNNETPEINNSTNTLNGQTIQNQNIYGQQFNNNTQPNNNNVLQGNIDQNNQPAGINNSPNNDEELLKSFIGKNYEKITTKPFNFAGFFFTTFYMFYRKMFLYGILLSILFLIIYNIINNFLIMIALSVAFGLCINKFYIYNAKKKIEKIKNKNPQKNSDEIKAICSKKGGTSVGLVILGFLSELGIGIIVLLIMLAIGLTSVLSGLFPGKDIINDINNQNNISNIEENNENNNITNENNNSTYNGMLSFDTSINISDYFLITVPSIFEDDSDNYEYEYKYESDTGVFDSCEVKLYAVTGYSSADNLINQIKNYKSNNNPTEIQPVTINNITWNSFSYTDSFGTSYYYGTNVNNKVFLLEYVSQKDTSSECESYREQIINSVKNK